ncbi:MAG: hypothetical protein LC775_14510, partial [Acidobacteria bacterium]|nr:hypothetical protein [Acidobacteriota bacterium]
MVIKPEKQVDVYLVRLRHTSVTIGLAFGLPVGLAAGLAIGVIISVVVGGVPKVVLTELVLAVSGAGRVKFMKVLEEAHRRQVLRQAGTLYQFRHGELQEYLAKIHE